MQNVQLEHGGGKVHLDQVGQIGLCLSELHHICVTSTVSCLSKAPKARGHVLCPLYDPRQRVQTGSGRLDKDRYELTDVCIKD